jgi:hypothetical protein
LVLFHIREFHLDDLKYFVGAAWGAAGLGGRAPDSAREIWLCFAQGLAIEKVRRLPGEPISGTTHLTINSLKPKRTAASASGKMTEN